MKITPEVIEREKWQVFWDAPLLVPGTAPRVRPTAPGEAADRNPGLPRKPNAEGVDVASDGTITGLF